MRDDCVCSNHAALAYRHSGIDNSVDTEPAVVLNPHGPIEQALEVARRYDLPLLLSDGLVRLMPERVCTARNKDVGRQNTVSAYVRAADHGASPLYGGACTDANLGVGLDFDIRRQPYASSC